MENDQKKINDTTSTSSGVVDKETRNENRKHESKSPAAANDMSQTVCLFRKYLLARTQQHSIGRTNMEESEVIHKSRCRGWSQHKFNPHNLSRPPSLLERNMFPALRCDSTVDKAPKAQLTIFYDGGVNVYDNVSAEKAKEIMLILDSESFSSKPVSKEAHPRSDFRASSHKSNINSVAYKSKSGIPLARKRSLQCFIEKRRDRMIIKAASYAVDSNPRNHSELEEGDEVRSRIDAQQNNENRQPLSISPFPSRLGYFLPVSAAANKGCY